jgi:hypothetical protein
MNIYPQNIGSDVKLDILRRRVSCHYIHVLINIAIARKETDFTKKVPHSNDHRCKKKTKKSDFCEKGTFILSSKEAFPRNTKTRARVKTFEQRHHQPRGIPSDAAVQDRSNRVPSTMGSREFEQRALSSGVGFICS